MRLGISDYGAACFDEEYGVRSSKYRMRNFGFGLPNLELPGGRGVLWIARYLRAVLPDGKPGHPPQSRHHALPKVQRYGGCV